MKIGCKCGAVIYDQTDFLPGKARLIADPDWEDFANTVVDCAQIDRTLTRACYQCESCGRLYVEGPDRELHTFTPEDTSGPLLTSSHGSAWKAPLVGNWSARPMFAGHAKGDLWCNSPHAHDTPREYESWPALEAAYFALFFQMQANGVLRSALLRKNNETVHVWPCD